MLQKTKLALVDDHQIVIDGLKSLLQGDPEFEISFSTTQSTEVLELLKNQEVDILLTDVMMPELSGLQLASAVKKKFPAIRILALSMNGEGDQVNDMIEQADIAGYILKNTGKSELIQALTTIASGQTYFSEEVLQALASDSQRKKENEEAHLTAREIEIIQLIEKELNNKQIAEALFISERTVETHRKNIFRKSGTNTVIGLIKYAYQHKLISR